MNQHDVDDLIREWADIGEEHLPDRYLQAALAEIETTPQSGAWLAPLKGLIMRFQPFAPFLAVATAVVAAVVLYGALAGPPVGNQNASPTPAAASPGSSASASPSPTAEPVVSQGTFEITSDTPIGSAPSRQWPQFLVVGDRLADGLTGYKFGQLGDRGVTIYLDPQADYAGSRDTNREDLVVSIFYTKLLGGSDSFVGLFESTSGECQVVFDKFTATAASGSLDCTDVPGTYSRALEGIEKEGTVGLSGTFSFDPSTEPLS